MDTSSDTDNASQCKALGSNVIALKLPKLLVLEDAPLLLSNYHHQNF